MAWEKAGGFIGREALSKRREAGIRQRLLQFAVQDAHPLMLHDEPILRNGCIVGRTTSGGRGFRTGKTHAMGYVACEPGETSASLIGSDYEISIAGVRYPAQAAMRGAYDPSGVRMRGQT